MKGSGEWCDNVIILSSFFIGFDKFEYGIMWVSILCLIFE